MSNAAFSGIRVASEEDADTIAALVNAAYRVEDFFIHGDRTDPDDIRTHMSEGEFLVFGYDDRIDGCVYVRTGGERAYFGMLSVDPGAQGSGLGRMLVAAAEDRARESGAAWMELLVVNLREELPPWYERLGYALTGKQEFPMPEKLKRPVEFLLMSKPLAGD